MAESPGTGWHVPYYGRNQNSGEEWLCKILNDLSAVLKMDELDKDLEDALERVYPNYLETLSGRANDLLKKDCAIIFTGETSAGKSSLINLVLGLETDILPEGVDATTKTICKIMHSEQKQIKSFDIEGKLIEEENIYTENHGNSSDFLETSENEIHQNQGFTQKDKTESPSTDEASQVVEESWENPNAPASILKNLFISASTTCPDIHSVEIHHPIWILKGNITIVDNPGVGDNKKLNDILEEYLPYAVAFVFVVNPTSGGGMQEDRILKVMKSIKAKEDMMMCFDPADVIFVVNKWDAMFDKTSPNMEKEWRDVVDKIKISWPSVNPDNIIKMSAKLVYLKDKTYSDNFSCFEKTLHSLVEKNINKRIENNFRFLVELLSKAEVFVNSRITAANQSFFELEGKIQTCFDRLEELKAKCERTSETCIEILDNAIQEHCNDLMTYIQSKDFRDDVLYRDSSLKNTARPKIGALISKRIENVISCWIERNDDEFKMNLDDAIRNKFHEIRQELDKILGEVGCASMNFQMSETLGKFFSEALKSKFYAIGAGVLSLSILVPFCTVEVCVTSVAVTMALSYKYAKAVLETLKLSVNEVIEESFLTRKNAITKKAVYQILSKKYGDQYKSIFENLFTKIIPKEIQNSRRFLKNLKDDYGGLKVKRSSLEKLSSEFAKIRMKLQTGPSGTEVQP